MKSLRFASVFEADRLCFLPLARMIGPSRLIGRIDPRNSDSALNPTLPGRYIFAYSYRLNSAAPGCRLIFEAGS